MGPYARFPAPRGCVPPPRFEGLRHTRCRPTAGTDRETVLPIRCRTSLAQSQTWISAGEPPRPAFSPACPLRCDVSPLTFFASIVGTPLLSGFHALTLDHAGTGIGKPHGLRARLRPHLVMQARPSAISAPQPEKMLDRGPGGQTMRHTGPCTPRAQHIQDTVHDFAPRHATREAGSP